LGRGCNKGSFLVHGAARQNGIPKVATMKSSIEFLNRLMQMHRRSLPMYLADATPWSASKRDAGQPLLASISADQSEIVDEIAELIQNRRGVVDRGSFPTEFADLNDLSLDYLIRQVAKKQVTQVAALQQATQSLANDQEALELCQRALGIARAHLDSLNEYIRDVL
jgi:hypothetical protein